MAMHPILPHPWPAVPVGVSPPVTVTLRSGVEVVFRPMTPADREIYLAGVEHVGPESRRMRFFAAKPWLSEGEIRYFTEVDHHDHEAILGLVDGAVVGIARIVRDRTDPRRAELGVVVVDEWHGRGVGTALVRRIVERAAEEGVDRVRASVLGDNVGMLATIRRLGLRTHTVSMGPVIEIDIETGRPTPERPQAA